MVSVFFYLPPFPRTVKDSENVLTPSPLNCIPRALARGEISLILMVGLFVYPPPPELYSEGFSPYFLSLF